MTAAAIVADLGKRGVRLRAEGEWLDCDAPRGVLTDDVLAMLRQHKPALLDYLAGSRPSHTIPQDRNTVSDGPGIVIVRPDRARMMAAVASLPEGPGDADETGIEEPPEFRSLDLTAPDCPAWVFDDSATFRPSDLRAAIEANIRMGG